MKRLLVSLATLILLPVSFAQAGNIDATHKYAFGNKMAWINFGTTEGNVTVTDTAVTGYAWSPIFGWIDLAPTNGGVQNTTSGTLSGYAWSEQMGWINFSGVTIDSQGYFHGNATGDVAGTISFNCDNTASCGSSDFKVKTTWVPTSEAVVLQTPAGSGRGGGYTNQVGVGGSAIIHESAPDESFEDIQDDIASVSSDLYCSAHIELDQGGIVPLYHQRGLRADMLIASIDTCSGDGCPRQYMTRAEFVKLLLESECFTPEIHDQDYFIDVDKTHAMRGYLDLAYHVGIITGYGDQSFRPEQPITVAESIAMLYRYFSITTGESTAFYDVETNQWYSAYVKHAFDHGVLRWFDEASHTLKPGRAATRTDLSHLIERITSLY